MAVLLDTRKLDVSDRAAALHIVLTGATAAHDLTLLGPADETFARLDHWQLNPDVALLRQASTGVSHTRTQRHARHDGPERVVFVLHSGAPGSYVHDGKRHPLHDGGLYVTDLNSCYVHAARLRDGANRPNRTLGARPDGGTSGFGSGNLRANLHRPELTAAEVAHQHGVSTRDLFQRWATRSRTLTETLAEIRMAAAYELLTADAALPISVVANRCGFVSASAFGRAFRRTYGVTPGNLRRREHG